MKQCARCREVKPESEFWRNAGKPDGRQTYCKACQTSYVARWRNGHQDELREAMRLRSQRYRERHAMG